MDTKQAYLPRISTMGGDLLKSSLLRGKGINRLSVLLVYLNMHLIINKHATFFFGILLLCLIELPSQSFQDTLQFHLKEALDSKDEQKIAEAYNELAYYCSEIKDHQLAIAHFNAAIPYLERINDVRGIGVSQFNLGNAYMQIDEYVPAMIYYQQALVLFDSIGFQLGMVAVNEGLGRVHDMQEEYNRSIDYFMRALELNSLLKDTVWSANVYNNMAIVMVRRLESRYRGKYGDSWQDSILLDGNESLLAAFDEITTYADSSIVYNELIGNRSGLAQARNTRNQITFNLGDFQAALDEYKMILNDYEGELSEYEIGAIMNNMAHCYMKLGQYANSKAYLEKSKELSDRLNSKDLKMHYYLKSSDLNVMQENYSEALGDYKLYTLYKDSLLNEEKLQALKDAEVKYETHAKEKEIVNLNRENLLKRRQMKVLVTGIGLIFVLLLVVLYFWNMTRRQNQQISEQKEEIDDSIKVAKDIQFAVIPAPESLKKTFDDFFVLFRPRDNVSGDFYWVSHENGKKYVLTADSTGHGVPGAFVSMMGTALIRETVALNPDANAATLLDELRSRLIDALNQSGLKEVSYGIDASLYILNEENSRLEFAGANNPLWILRGAEIISFRGSNMPIGRHPNCHEPFNNKTVELQKGDTLITFSDGFIDQFGGDITTEKERSRSVKFYKSLEEFLIYNGIVKKKEKALGKKYMKGKLKKLLVTNAGASMKSMEELLNKELDQWQGDLPQTDDILVIGIRV